MVNMHVHFDAKTCKDGMRLTGGNPARWTHDTLVIQMYSASLEACLTLFIKREEVGEFLSMIITAKEE